MAIEDSEFDGSTTSEEEFWASDDSLVARNSLTSTRRLSTESVESCQQAIAACLPSELVLEIFSHLFSPRDLFATLLTCRSWCLCSVEMMWYKPHLFSPSSLLKLISTLKSADQSFEYATFIRRLNFSYLPEQVSDAVLLKLESCRRLERLTLLNCKRVTDRGLCDIIARNTGLIALDVSNLEHITDLPILAAAGRNKGLQGLNLTGCIKITEDAVISIAKSCTQLKRIKLNQCAELRDAAVLSIANHSKLLLEIDLDHCHQVTSIAVNTLLRNCLELRELRLNMCNHIDDSCFINLKRGLYPNLRTLDLTGCSRITDDSVYHIVSACPRLRTLVLAKCPNITDRGAVQIARLGKYLHFLHLGHCSQLTDRCIAFIASYCNRLRYIDLACCVQLTDHAVEELAALPRLKRIGLVKCSGITAVGINALVRRNMVQHTLERIHLSYCYRLDVECIRSLLNACRHLTHISLTGIAGFLRNDLRKYCRESPEEFNPAQASVFCVFSAGGVPKLRAKLNALHDSPLGYATPNGYVHNEYGNLIPVEEIYPDDDQIMD